MDKGLLTSIIDFLPDATFVVDKKGKVAAWNKAMENMTGVKGADILGEGDYVYSIPFYGERRPMLIDFVSAGDAAPEGLYDSVKQHESTLFAKTLVPFLNGGKGAYLWGAASPLPGNGGCWGAIESLRDITERKAEEEKLRARDLLLSAQQETSMDGILSVGDDGRILSHNRRFADMWGIPPRDLEGQPVASVVRSLGSRLPDFEKLGRRIQHLCRQRYGTTRDEIVGRDGTVLDLCSAPIPGPGGEHRGRVWYFRDITLQRKAEEALEESEEKLRLLFERSQDPTVLLDEAAYADCNEATVRLTGCTDKKQLIGLHPWDFAPERQPDGRLSREKALEHIGFALKEGAHRFEWMGRSLRGEEFWVEASLTTIPVRGKRVLYSVWKNMGEQKTAEEALGRVRQRCRTLFENVREGIFRATPAGGYLGVNPAHARMLGYESPEDLMGSVTDVGTQVFLRPESYERMMESVEKEGIVEAFETELSRKDGSTVWVSIRARAVRSTKGRLLSWEGTAEDITKRKAAEAKLRWERAFTDTLILESPAFCVALAADGRILRMNRSLLGALGYTMEETAGKDYLTAFIPPDQRSALADIFRKLLTKNKSAVTESPILGKDGGVRLVEWHIRPVRNEKDEFKYFFGVGIDVTERRRVEGSLRRREAELEARTVSLRDVNTALKVLLKQRENDKAEMGEKILSNVKTLVLPYLEKLKKLHLGPARAAYVDIIETNLGDIISPFMQKMNSDYPHLSPTEAEIANLIRGGKRTKEISDVLHISPGTVKFHRNNIRKKLGLNKRKTNLRSHLVSLSKE